MDGKVKINYELLNSRLNEAAEELNGIWSHVFKLQEIAASKENWTSEFADKFRSHLETGVINKIKKLMVSYAQQLSKAERCIKDYQKLDKY